MLAGLFLAAALMAEPAVGAEAKAGVASAAKPEGPKKVCVLQAQTGSHFKKRICATPEEWEERRRRDAEEMAKMSDRQGFCRGDNC
ncbi:hypothetical protein [Phenylobacterium sp. SCN 70-31]|uniref:hypothetical protein n=1 Tax=Phenylobacterium sp. SCN 70-31 TaxID=1660129 RepID=UPI00086F485B|nr:hypothetical protein [Phenylobacterium sp. SCN 70-31]ODT86807.1 MAG: hypothetical protein ABS78_14230 [Phenylobacterium sp. SCN 70-31]